MLQEGPFLWATALLASGSIALAAFAQDAGNHEGATPADVARVIKPEFSPYAGRSFPTRPLFGDTHLHTAISVDAGTMNRVGQEDAFRFARGEEVVSTGGLRARLGRPLDFLVISDHAEMYGLMPQLLSGDPEVLATEAGNAGYSQLTGGDRDTIFADARRRGAGDQAGVLALCRAQLPDAAAVRRHPPAHRGLGRRRHDEPARAGGRLPLRPRRGGHLDRRPARQAVAAARLPGDLGPRRDVRPDAAAPERRSRGAGHRGRTALVRRS